MLLFRWYFVEWCVMCDFCVCDDYVNWVEIGFDLCNIGFWGFIVCDILFVGFDFGFSGKSGCFFFVVSKCCCNFIVFCFECFWNGCVDFVWFISN